MLFFGLFSFTVGAVFGSFLNVVAERSFRKESITGRSRCEFCKRRLGALDLVPVLSFVFLGGRCRYCRRRLSIQYPISEILTGIIFLSVFYYLYLLEILNPISVIYFLAIACVMVVVGIIDFKYYLIPTTYVFGASLLSLFYNYFFLNSTGFIDHVIAGFAAALFFLLIVLITFGKGMGEGDIILGFLIGIVLGTKAAFVSIFAAFLIGALVSVVLLFIRRKRFGQAVPFGPFLILGYFISLFWGEALLSWYLMLY